MKFKDYITEGKTFQAIRKEAETTKDKFSKLAKEFDNPNNREGAKKIVKAAEMILKLLDKIGQ